MKEKIKKIINDESSGEIMIESTMIMVFVWLILFALLSLGFLFYQKIAIDVLANNIASDIAASYKEVSVDPTTHEVALYRTTLFKGKTEEKQKARAEAMLEDQINIVSLGADNNAKVKEFKVCMDDIGLAHVEVTIESNCFILFGGFLEAFGIEDARPTFTSTGRAQCVDITGCSGQVEFMEYAVRKLEENDTAQTILDGINNIRSILRTLEIIE